MRSVLFVCVKKCKQTGAPITGACLCMLYLQILRRSNLFAAIANPLDDIHQNDGSKSKSACNQELIPAECIRDSEDTANTWNQCDCIETETYQNGAKHEFIGHEAHLEDGLCIGTCCKSLQTACQNQGCECHSYTVFLRDAKSDILGHDNSRTNQDTTCNHSLQGSTCEDPLVNITWFTPHDIWLGLLCTQSNGRQESFTRLMNNS